jgi:hypothetical protein
MIRALASALVEQHESFLAKQCMDAGEANTAGLGPHPIQEFIAAARPLGA